MNTLFFDIENSPLTGTAWGTYQTDLLSILKDTELLSFAYQVNDGPVLVVSRRLYSEKQMVKHLWKLFDEADVIIGHNGDKFDIKMSNMYFLRHKLPPPSPYKTVDTLKIAKKYFKFPKNRLDFIGKFLFNEGKISTSLELWFDCMKGNTRALRLMERYNKQDVVLLRKVYDELKGWHTGHPNSNVYNGTTHNCPACASPKTQKRGFMYTRVGKYQKHQCTECGGWWKGDKIKTNKVIS